MEGLSAPFHQSVDLCGHAHRVKSRAKQPQQPLSTGFVYPFCLLHRQCPPLEAATAPLVASPRADDRRSGPGRDATPLCPKGPEDGQDQGGGERRVEQRHATDDSSPRRHAVLHDGRRERAGAIRCAAGSGPGAASAGGDWAAHGGELRARARPRCTAAGEEESRAAALQVMVADFMVEKAEAEREKRAEERRMKEINDRVGFHPDLVVQMAAWRRWAGLPPSFLHCGDKEEEEIAEAPMCARTAICGGCGQTTRRRHTHGNAGLLDEIPSLIRVAGGFYFNTGGPQGTAGLLDEKSSSIRTAAGVDTVWSILRQGPCQGGQVCCLLLQTHGQVCCEPWVGEVLHWRSTRRC